MNSAYSVSSIRPMIDGKPNIRRITSALMPSIIAAINSDGQHAQERTSQPFSQKMSAHAQRDSSDRSRLAAYYFDEQRLQLRDRFGAQLLEIFPIEIDGGLS